MRKIETRVMLIGYGFIFVSLLAICVALVMSLPSELSKDIQWASWASAFGSVGAIAAAIWLATTQERRRQNEAIALAHLTAVAMIPRLKLITINHEMVIRNLEARVKQGSEMSLDFSGCARQLEGQLWTPGDIIPLLVMDKRCAANLAAASEQIVVLKDIFAHAIQSDRVADNCPDFIKTMLESTYQTKSLIEYSLNECVKAEIAMLNFQ